MILKAKDFSQRRKNGFIVLEGVNGAGKTTVKSHLISILKSKNIDYLDTFEPGDTPLGKHLRELLLGHNRDIKSSLAELLLFAADRAEHVERLIKPALQAGKLVICDRYYYSTIAFQGYGRKQDLDLIETLNNIAICQTLPDFVFLLDIDPAIGLQRNKKSNSSADTFSIDALEKEELDFHKRIRAGFLNIAESCKEPVVVIDAGQPLENVLAETESALTSYLQKPA